MATKQQTIFSSILFGLQLLPSFVQGAETLFGKGTGETKKQAVTQLVNTSILGSAVGLGLAGDPDVSQGIAAFGPALSQTIDQLAKQLFPSSSTT